MGFAFHRELNGFFPIKWKPRTARQQNTTKSHPFVGWHGRTWESYTHGSRMSSHSSFGASQNHAPSKANHTHLHCAMVTHTNWTYPLHAFVRVLSSNGCPFHLKFLQKKKKFRKKRKVLGSVMYPSSNAVRMTPPPTHGREYFLSSCRSGGVA